MHIFIVDDEPDLCEILSFNFASEGFATDVAYSGEEALSWLATHRTDLVVLDVMMHQISGFEVAAQMRSRGDNTPIIFLTAMDGNDAQLEGFEVGADDYIAKPFSFDTVLARVRAVLRRSAQSGGGNATVFGALAVDFASSIVSVGGTAVVLTKKEYDILAYFVRSAGIYHSRQDIIEAVWGGDVCVSERSVDVHIARLRKKLAAAGQMIVNRTGYGYAFVPSK